MEAIILPSVITRFKNGKEITDKELDVLIKHYSNLKEALFQHDQTYYLVYKDVSNELIRAEDMKTARKSK